MKKFYLILKILFKFILLIFPIGIGGWLILTKYNYLAYFNDLPKNNYSINSIFLIFILIGLLPILINLIFYCIDFSDFGFEYSGKNKSVRSYIKMSQFLILILTIIISIFVFIIITKLISFSNIINYNRWVSLLIFFIFGIIDSLLIKSEKIRQKNLNDDLTKIKSNNNVTLSKESIFLINIPTFTIILLSYLFVHTIEHIEYFKEIINQKDFLKIITIPISDSKIHSIFISGIETGIIMTSLVFSQIIFFVIKTKWDYKDFIIETKKVESPAGNKVYKALGE